MDKISAVAFLECFRGLVGQFPPPMRLQANHLAQVTKCCTPTLAKCGGEAQHLEKLGFGVLWDSRMFRAQQQGRKHLALGCSWCHWKGLET